MPGCIFIILGSMSLYCSILRIERGNLAYSVAAVMTCWYMGVPCQDQLYRAFFTFPKNLQPLVRLTTLFFFLLGNYEHTSFFLLPTSLRLLIQLDYKVGLRHFSHLYVGFRVLLGFLFY